jgi:hypothetical protein
MAKIRQSNLDNTVVTGLGELSSVASGDQTIIYDASTGTLKKISQTNFLNFPAVSSVSPTSVTSGDGTGNYTFTITGTGFTSGTADLINNSGTAIAFDTVTVDSDTQITGVIAKSSLPGSGEPYDVRVTSTTGLRATLENQINIDQSPTFNTAAGSLGSMIESGTFNFTVEAYDPESAGNVTFELQSGSIPAGLTTSTTHENGVSKFIIGGTASAVGSDTTSTFTVRASDAASNTSSRQFSITVTNGGVTSFTSSGTFLVPNGLTSLDVLVIAGGGGGGGANAPVGRGGGGGAGGLIYFPSYPVSTGTITVTVGCGGGGGTGFADGSTGQDSSFGSPGDPGLGQGGVLTAKGGGLGGGGKCRSGCGQPNAANAGGPGGSGGSSGYPRSAAQGGTAIQPTQPDNSGAYGFGFPGADQPSSEGSGGGGAGGKGFTNVNNPSPTGPGTGGGGGIGKAYSISGTSVNYAGGGGGGGVNFSDQTSQTGVGYGGGRGAFSTGVGANGCSGTANRGGGGGGAGSDTGTRTGGAGGKGIVIIST